MGKLENAAEEVLRAMRALDAHRHDGAPTLEREYRRALESYFVAAESALGRDAAREALDPTDLDDESGDDDALSELDSPERGGIEAIRGHYAAARQALRLARAYGGEPRTSGRRERECVEAALRHREAIRALRLRMRPPAQQLLLPGLAKTRAPSESAATGPSARTG